MSAIWLFQQYLDTWAGVSLVHLLCFQLSSTASRQLWSNISFSYFFFSPCFFLSVFTVVNVCACVCCTNTRLLGLCLLSVPDKKGSALGRSENWKALDFNVPLAPKSNMKHYLFTCTCRNYFPFLQTGVLAPSHGKIDIASASVKPWGKKSPSPEVYKFSFHMCFSSHWLDGMSKLHRALSICQNDQCRNGWNRLVVTIPRRQPIAWNIKATFSARPWVRRTSFRDASSGGMTPAPPRVTSATLAM